jgi:peptidoglycan/xylan/chitin deacetylase (PgdA/CDA1 family)
VQTLRLLVVSDAEPRLAWRLAERIKNEVPEVSICGLVYQEPKKLPKSLKDRLKNGAVYCADILLRVAHAFPVKGSKHYCFTPDDLARRGAACGWPVKLCDRLQSSTMPDLVRGLNPDLCVVWMDPAIASDLPVIIGHDVITLNRAPRGETHQGIEVRASHIDKEHVSTVTLCSASLPVEPYDTTVSQKLKSDLISMDLLVQSVATIARGNAIQHPLRADNLLPHLRYWHQRTTGNGTANPPTLRTRPWWKLCVASLLLAPYTIMRNWYRRWRGRFPVTILFHHMISDVPHHLGMPTDAFFREVKYLARHYRIVSLSEATELLRSGKVKEPTVVLTFDDGYQENFITLRAVTEATGVPVACFVCTQIAAKQGELDHDVRQNERNFLSMNWEQIEYVSRNGVEIGSHTRTHIDCGTCKGTILREEIRGAKADLEQHLQAVRFFAFPYGKRENMSAEALELAAAAHECLLSCLGEDNFPEPGRVKHHLLRKALPSDVWELELTLQSILDLKKLLKRRMGFGEESRMGNLSASAANSQ